MSNEHWLLLAGFMGVIGAQLVILGDSWEHIGSPLFWGTVLVQIGILIRASYKNVNGNP